MGCVITPFFLAVSTLSYDLPCSIHAANAEDVRGHSALTSRYHNLLRWDVLAFIRGPFWVCASFTFALTTTRRERGTERSEALRYRVPPENTCQLPARTVRRPHARVNLNWN